MGLGVWGWGFGGWGFLFGVWDWGSGVLDFCCMVYNRREKRRTRRVSNLGFGFWGLGLEVWGFGFLILGVGPARRKEDQASRKCFLEVVPVSSKYSLLPRSTSYLLEVLPTSWKYFLLPGSSAAALTPPQPPVSAIQGLLECRDTRRP